jgi:hypothetical protein
LFLVSLRKLALNIGITYYNFFYPSYWIASCLLVGNKTQCCFLSKLVIASTTTVLLVYFYHGYSSHLVHIIIFPNISKAHLGFLHSHKLRICSVIVLTCLMFTWPKVIASNYFTLLIAPCCDRISQVPNRFFLINITLFVTQSENIKQLPQYRSEEENRTLFKI